MRFRPTRRLRAALANASLRVRVMAVAAFLVMITSVVMGSLGTALLHGYLLGRADQQLRDFAAVAGRNLAAGPPRSPGPAARQPQPALPVPDRDHQRRRPGLGVTEAPLHHAAAAPD